MSALNILCLILWLVVVPFCMGLLFFPLVGKTFRTPAMALTAGYILLFMLLELIGIPVVLLAVYNGFTLFVRLFIPCILLCAAAGILITLYRKKQSGAYIYEMSRAAVRPDNTKREISLEGKIVFGLFLILVGFQLYMAFTQSSSMLPLPRALLTGMMRIMGLRQWQLSSWILYIG